MRDKRLQQGAARAVAPWRGDSRARRDHFVRVFAERMLADEGTGVMLVDADYRIVEANPMASAIFGGDRFSWEGQPADVWAEELGVVLPFGRSILQGESFRNRKVAWTRDGVSREVVVDGDALVSGGQVIGAYMLFHDVTPWMMLEEQVRRSDRLKMIGQVAAGTAHEIRNPLTAIKGFVQLMKKSFDERQMGKEQNYANIVLSELDRVQELVGEFLLLSKSKETKLSSLRIGAVMREMLPMLRNEATLHDITVRYESKPDLPPVLADKEMLKQVILNLGKNAIEAMGKGGRLLIRERHSDAALPGYVSVDISDTGSGIPPHTLERIFDPFYTTKENGTGLGLSICQRIVHDLGGEIGVESSADGTVFTVSIPSVSSDPGIQSSGGGALPHDDV
ncbi:ATP-binding protein [Cohnella sp. JJ-181]|uniref:ATP-binding protein n=1 Tax=Cohnella rhizoplanae TaxID=2974897 RepID=UPI0022FF717A|nr:ATP-binding protein [Cohnella sp. JJ-181]CAI6087480.1 Sporulation kinase E [Cohnella sp. JJ-181]